MQIGQPRLVTILLNPSFLDSAFFGFSRASSSIFVHFPRYDFYADRYVHIDTDALYELDITKPEEQTRGLCWMLTYVSLKSVGC